jgi:hypothetical protein
MVQVDPHLYCKYIIHNKRNQPLLYIKLTKAIYGLLKSALLFYRKFVNDLNSYSSPFIINPYNPCVANVTVGNKQIMVTCHMDNLKVSHIEPFQVTKFATYLALIYMATASSSTADQSMTALEIYLNFSQPGIAQISVIKYTTKVIDDFPKTIITTFTTPAADHLFTVQDKQEAKLLPEQQAQAFHHTVAQLLFLCKCT